VNEKKKGEKSKRATWAYISSGSGRNSEQKDVGKKTQGMGLWERIRASFQPDGLTSPVGGSTG